MEDRILRSLLPPPIRMERAEASGWQDMASDGSAVRDCCGLIPCFVPFCTRLILPTCLARAGPGLHEHASAGVRRRPNPRYEDPVLASGREVGAQSHGESTGPLGPASWRMWGERGEGGEKRSRASWQERPRSHVCCKSGRCHEGCGDNSRACGAWGNPGPLVFGNKPVV